MNGCVIFYTIAYVSRAKKNFDAQTVKYLKTLISNLGINQADKQHLNVSSCGFHACMKQFFKKIFGITHMYKLGESSLPFILLIYGQNNVVLGTLLYHSSQVFAKCSKSQWHDCCDIIQRAPSTH